VKVYDIDILSLAPFSLVLFQAFLLFSHGIMVGRVQQGVRVIRTHSALVT